MKKNFLTNQRKKTNITYGFFTKNGGYSINNYKSLNCSLSSKDKVSDVKKNIEIAKKNLALKKSKLKIVNQIHSNKVKLINSNNFSKKYTADGIITQDKNISLGVLTADCCPIFIYDLENSFICCLHAGWKGCLKNIVKSAMEKIQRIQKNHNKIYAIIGPCLNLENFEVSIDFKKKFILENNSYKQFFFKIKKSNKYLFDMRNLIAFQFKKNKIKNIKNIDLDTYKNIDLFFSHRRSTHNNELPTGRMINIIGFNNT